MFLNLLLRLKFHATKKKDDMFDRLETDVELAIADYNAALEEEDKAEVDTTLATHNLFQF